MHYSVAPIAPIHDPNLQFGPLELATAPTVTVTNLLSLFKTHLHIHTSDATRDDYLEHLLTAAIDWCENAIPGGRQFFTAEWILPIRGWWRGPLKLPRPRLQAVNRLYYIDTAGVEQTVSSSLYSVALSQNLAGTIEMLQDFTWPALRVDRAYPIRISFDSGYGDETFFPAVVNQAILLLAGHWHEYPIDFGTQSGGKIEEAVRNLLDKEGYGSHG